MLYFHEHRHHRYIKCSMHAGYDHSQTIQIIQSCVLYNALPEAQGPKKQGQSKISYKRLTLENIIMQKGLLVLGKT